MSKDKITITLDADLLEELRKEAKEEGHSLSEQINNIFKWYLTQGQNWTHTGHE